MKANCSTLINSICQLFTTVFQSQLLFWNSSIYLSFHSCITNCIKLWSLSTHFNRSNHRSHSERKQDTTPEHATYKMINRKCLRQERHHDNQSFASVLSTPHTPAPTSPENSCGARAAWTEVKRESKCKRKNCSNRRNTENYGFYRAGHL